MRLNHTCVRLAHTSFRNLQAVLAGPKHLGARPPQILTWTLPCLDQTGRGPRLRFVAGPKVCNWRLWIPEICGLRQLEKEPDWPVGCLLQVDGAHLAIFKASVSADQQKSVL